MRGYSTNRYYINLDSSQIEVIRNYGRGIPMSAGLIVACPPSK